MYRATGEDSTLENGRTKDKTNPSMTVEFVPPLPQSTKKKKVKGVSYFQMFKYASKLERSLVFVGIFFALVSGCLMPFTIVLYGEYTTLLVDRNTPNKTTVTPTVIALWFNGGRETNGSAEDKAAAMREDAAAFGLGFTLIAILQFSVSFAFVTCLNYSSLLQIAKLRRIFLKSMLRQEMSWYDCNDVHGYPSKMIENLDKVQEGIGEKIGIFIYLVMGFKTAVTVAFFYGWKLTLVMLSCAPVLALARTLVGKVETSLREKEMEAYSKAGSVAGEVFSSIKTVMSFNGQKKEIERYNEELQDSLKAGIRRGLLSGLGGGVMWFITYSCYALAFWYGISLILESRLANNFEYTPSVLLITFFGVLVGAINLGQTTPHLEAFSAARGAASSVYSLLDRTSKIDSLSTEGKTLSDFKGEVLFKNVSFHYPSRPEVKVLKTINLHIKSGEMVALVGASGCGKSTLVQLLQRFYDPSEGSVQLDGTDLPQLNVSWLRKQLGIVGQEPSLFDTTIYENIKYGLESATRENVEEAAKLADAHNFIMKLPNGYQTVIGTKGSRISGGQKQRIAIARALIRNPKILILDEATSALDAASESKVQETLDRAVEGRTTLVVTHKLSAIAKADKIVVLSGGRIVEEGNHEELLELKGHYYKFLEMQELNEKSIDNFEDEKMENEKSSFIEKSLPALYPQASVLSLSPLSPTEKFPEEKAVVPEEEIRPASFIKILKYNKSEWWAILIGVISTIIVGGNVPALSILFGELYGVLSESDVDFIKTATAYYSGFLFALGILVGTATFFQSYLLNYASVKLTSNFRKMGFAAILNQEANWFDEENHQAGALCAKLSSDAAHIQGASGCRVGAVVQSVSTILFGIGVGFLYSWKLALVALSTTPLIFFGMYFQAKMIEKHSILENSALEKATKISVEAVSNIRTVTSFGREQYFLDLYDAALVMGESGMKKKSQLKGLAFASGASATYLSYALTLWYGGILTANGELHYKNVIKVAEAILFGMWVLGQSLAFAPNFTQAKLSAARLLQLIERSPKMIDGTIAKHENWKADGRINFSKVEFSYPTRPNVEVLKGLDLDISKGHSIALIGPSGCGKSTVLQLLQRLYDPSEGKIYLDDYDISSLKISNLRHQYGIVSQEPVLFDRTIGENIAYGNNSRVVSEAEIISAAKCANIHEFIVSLPLGYKTRAGSAGAQLSGGQKQRIAIARALIRNPKILLLDEATSALDAESESLVQATLDSASSGRTTITIGHRLGAMKNADVIYLLHKGKVRQSFTFETLMKQTLNK